MSRQTEKTMKELNAYLKAQRPDGPSEEEMNDLIQQFMREKNAQLSLGGEYYEPETADEYLELAEEENSKKKQIEYLNKALDLEPDNLDAGRMMAELTAKNPYALMEELSRLLEKGNRQMMKEGYFADEYKGDFWGVIETRPYMRLRHLYMHNADVSLQKRIAAYNQTHPGERSYPYCEWNSCTTVHKLVEALKLE